MKIKPHKTGPRLYTNGRGSVPSVTEILKVAEKPYFERWRQKVGIDVAREKMESAATFGTRVHAVAELIAWERAQDIATEMQPYAEAVRGFLYEYVEKTLGTEIELLSDKYLFGGTLDLYCGLRDGSFAVVDYKTTSSLTREHGLQTAAYALLCRENNMIVNRRLAVRIKKDAPGEFWVREYRDHAEDVDAFLSLSRFWWWRHRDAMRKRGITRTPYDGSRRW